MDDVKAATLLAQRIQYLREHKATMHGAELHLAEYRRIGEVYDIATILGLEERVKAIAPVDPQDSDLAPMMYRKRLRDKG